MKLKKILNVALVLAIVFTFISEHSPGKVLAAPQIALNRKSVTMTEGSKFRLKVNHSPKNAKVTWTSSNKKKATVNAKGLVTAKEAGNVTIRGNVTYSQNGKEKNRKLSCKITVHEEFDLGKSLIVYFSVPEISNGSNTEVDAVASASIVVSGGKNLGNVQYVASVIQKNTGAGTFRIQPKEAYTTNHEDLIDQVVAEQEGNARPAIKNEIRNLNQYDTVFIGYPIWGGELPYIMKTFFDTYDFSGKTIIPFVVHGGSGLSGTVSQIQKLEPNAVVYKKALSISRDNVSDSEGRITTWLDGVMEK